MKSSEVTIINGVETSNLLLDKIAQAVTQLKKKHNITPGLAVILVGEDGASQVYVNKKTQVVQKIGMKSFKKILPVTITEDELLAQVESFNNNPEINGILVQLPLPKHINSDKILNAINHQKDVDGFHIQNAGKLLQGLPSTVPCTPLGSLILLEKYLGDLSGKTAVVLGRSNIVGKPMGQLLLQKNCTVIQAHSRTKSLPDVCRLADIVVVAVGKPELVDASWLKEGCVVIDVGINALDVDKITGKRKLVGDVNFASACEKVSAITPVPGGVGPMTIACLMYNNLHCTYLANELPINEITNLPFSL